MRYGRWYRDQEYLCIRVRPGFTYEIPLTWCRAREERERWLDHMAEKTWISQGDLIDLETAFEQIFTGVRA